MPIPFNAIVVNSITKSMLIDAPVSFFLNMKTGNNLRFLPKMLGTVGFSALGYIIRDSLNYFIDDDIALKPIISGSIGGAIKYTLINSHHTQRQSILEIALTTIATSTLSANLAALDDNKLKRYTTDHDNNDDKRSSEELSDSSDSLSQKQNDEKLDNVEFDRNIGEFESNDFLFQQQSYVKPDDIRVGESIVNSIDTSGEVVGVNLKKSASVGSLSQKQSNASPDQPIVILVNGVEVGSERSASVGSSSQKNGKENLDNARLSIDASEVSNPDSERLDPNPELEQQNEVILEEANEVVNRQNSNNEEVTVDALEIGKKHDDNKEISSRSSFAFPIQKQSTFNFKLAITGAVNNAMYESLNYYQICNKNQILSDQNCRVVGTIAIEIVEGLLRLALNIPSVSITKTKMDTISTALLAGVATASASYLYEIYSPSVKNKISCTNSALVDFYNYYGPNVTMSDIYDASYNVSIKNTSVNLGMRSTVTCAHSILTDIYSASLGVSVGNTTFNLGINNTVVYAKDTLAYLYDNYAPNITGIIYGAGNGVVDFGSQDNSTTDL